MIDFGLKISKNKNKIQGENKTKEFKKSQEFFR